MELNQREAEQLKFLEGAQFEALNCNLCGRGDFYVLARRDGLGLAVRTVMCRSCGLIAINPRLTKSWYERYYAYMGKVRSAYKHGVENPKERIGAEFEAVRRHGRALAERMRPFLRSGLTVDVGSSEGGLLAGIREVIPIDPIGIEPTVARAEFARTKGIPTYAAMIENIGDVAPDLPPAVNILCTKSLNHLLDPAFFFRWAYDTLDNDGRLILEVKNFRQQARMSGRLHYAIQIDHPFMFVPETLTTFVEAAGFAVQYFDVDEEKSRSERWQQKKTGLPVGHVRLVARKTDRPPFAGPIAPHPEVVRRLRRQFSPFSLRLHYFFYYAQPFRNAMHRLETAIHAGRY